MDPKNPSVAVVVSTYNGARFIAEQLDSILAQDIDNLQVFVRDDGSRDETVSILESYAAKGLITMEAARNAGVTGSFIDAVAHVADTADYVALCDQDDVWHTDKLSRALEVLEGTNPDVPQLYCAEYMFCDGEMHPTGRSHLNKIGVTFETMLYDNAVSGNTCVMNRTLAQLVAMLGAEGVYCHDWWIALLATAFGELHYDDFSCLEYRRLSESVSPTGTGGLKLLRYRLRTFFEKGELSNIIRQLERLEGITEPTMSPEKRDLLETFLHGNRLQKATCPKRLRQKMVDEAALRVLFLAGAL